MPRSVVDRSGRGAEDGEAGGSQDLVETVDAVLVLVVLVDALSYAARRWMTR